MMGRPAASNGIRTTRPSPQHAATSDPPSGATARWHTASPASTGPPNGSNVASPVRRNACTVPASSSAA